jgi:hypothetical protein
MRALILLLSLVVAGLALSILLHDAAGADPTPTFRAGLFIGDAQAGEEVVYRDQNGNTMTFKVESVDPLRADHWPVVHVRRTLADRAGRPLASDLYAHETIKHFLFPLTAPQDPGGLDRVWVLARLERALFEGRGAPRLAWRATCEDPALPPDSSKVVAWLDEKVPVFGLLQWQRGDATWRLQSWSPQ